MNLPDAPIAHEGFFATEQPALPDSNDLALLLSRKNLSKRDILGT
jgi:hypothetical protein